MHWAGSRAKEGKQYKRQTRAIGAIIQWFNQLSIVYFYDFAMTDFRLSTFNLVFDGLEEMQVNLNVHESSVAKIFHNQILFLCQGDCAIYMS